MPHPRSARSATRGLCRSAGSGPGEIQAKVLCVPAPRPIDKSSLLDALLASVRADLDVATAAARAAHEAATHEEAKPENDKDTRSIEAAYLAGAQGERVRELTRTQAIFERTPRRSFGQSDVIAAGALVTLKQGSGTLVCFIAQGGGGIRLQLETRSIQVVSLASPLGQALLGRSVGDEIEVELGKTVKTYVVEALE